MVREREREYEIRLKPLGATGSVLLHILSVHWQVVALAPIDFNLKLCPCRDYYASVVVLNVVKLCFVQVVAVARKAGGHYVDPNQELIALGMANLVCSLFHGFPVTGTYPGPH